ncbi:MAG: PP2C family protein-serine/threonine phosphatase [Lachnospiraceae bacterium]|nr:PP2C family protein-serine/threonine phosphatase [Lachnospiraceae bacterium]
MDRSKETFSPKNGIAELTENTTGNSKQMGLLIQLTLFFLIGVVITGFLAYFTLNRLSDISIKNQQIDLSEDVSAYVISTVTDYPAYEWLIDYWLDNIDNLDLEYDKEDITNIKIREFAARNPGFVINKATAAEVNTLSDEDKKAYAEIIYNQLLLKINDIKNIYGVSYISLISAPAEHDRGTFIMSASDGKTKRGTDYDNAYILGTEATATLGQKKAMDLAYRNHKSLVDSGKYSDQYTYLHTDDNEDIYIIITIYTNILTEDIRYSAHQSIVNFLILQIMLSILCLLMISQFMLRPLKKVQKSLRNYKNRKNSSEVINALSRIKVHNEIDSLSQDVSEMAIELDNYMEEIKTITSEKERIGAELEMAASIQAHVLPDPLKAFPDRKDFRIFATMNPAKEVGGDFYDFFMIDDDHLGIVVADVSGKGVPASLFMMVAKALIKNSAQSGLSPSLTLSQVNDQLCENNEDDMFVTVWFGILCLTDGKLIYSDAGHEVMIIRSDSDCSYIPKKSKPAVACLPGMKYNDMEITLKPGDLLFQYTDGVTEATNSGNELFGSERLLDTIKGAPSNEPIDLLPYVRSKINDFVKEAPQFDDITMVGLLYTGKTDS